MEVYKHDDMFYYKEFVNNLIENKDYLALVILIKSMTNMLNQN